MKRFSPTDELSKQIKEGGLTREFSSTFMPVFNPCTVLPSATPTPRGCTQLLRGRCRLHCILRNGRGNDRQLHCLRFLFFSHQVDCTLFFVWLVTSSSITRLYRGRAPRQSVYQFYVLPHMRQSWETMTSVSAGNILLTPTPQ